MKVYPILLLVSTTYGLHLECKGRGPPLYFSTGLYGKMPRFLYSKVMRELEKDFTVFTCPDGIDEKEGGFSAIADEIGSETVALVCHSSIDKSVLSSPRLEKAVLCDPAVFPEISLPFLREDPFLSPPSVSVSCPVLVIRTESAYDTFIPSSFLPKLEGQEVSEVIFQNAGHADLLDGRWSFFSEKLSFLKSRKRIVSFSEWGSKPSSSELDTSSLVGDEYRQAVCSIISRFLLPSNFRGQSVVEDVLDVPCSDD